MSTQFEGIWSPAPTSIDPSHSEVGFTVRHLLARSAASSASSRAPWPSPSTRWSRRSQPRIELSSVDTRNNDRDNHLRSGDFFSVESTPKMTFAQHRLSSRTATSSSPPAT